MERSPAKVAVDLTPLLPGGQNGGAKVFILELLRGLAALAPATSFILLTNGATHEELSHLECANMRRLRVGPDPVSGSLGSRLRRRIIPLWGRLPERLRRRLGDAARGAWGMLKRRRPPTLLRSLGVDLLYCPFPAVPLAEPGITIVCTIYDLQYRTYPQFFAAADRAERHRNLLAAVRANAAFAAISDYARDSALAHLGIDPGRIRTIHLRLARRVSEPRADSGQVLRELQLDAGRYFIYPANFWPHKNHETLLKAFEAARRRGLPDDFKLLCPGADSERRRALAQIAREMGLGERVVFPGYVTDQDLAMLLHNASAMVFPSRYEGYGLPVIEAMASGIPVACGNVAALPEIAAGAAIMFDPEDASQIAAAMLAMVGDAALRERLIGAGRERAAAFSDAKRMEREYWDLFRAALARTERI